MTIELNEDIRGLWYCSTIPGEQDFLLALSQISEECFSITYRFRYYNSDDPFDLDDKKSWYAGKVEGESEKEIIDRIHNQIMPVVSCLNDDGTFVELLRGDRSFDDFMEEFMKQDFVHAQQVH